MFATTLLVLRFRDQVTWGLISNASATTHANPVQVDVVVQARLQLWLTEASDLREIFQGPCLAAWQSLNRPVTAPADKAGNPAGSIIPLSTRLFGSDGNTKRHGMYVSERASSGNRHDLRRIALLNAGAERL
jgi:hypothetical protein